MKTLFDKKTTQPELEEHEGQSRAASALEIQKRSSEESFNVERFKDRLFNLSQAAGKEQPTI